jgi:predicted phosphodiesterase
MSLVIYGDPHGAWAPLREAVAERPPKAIVLLGDCELVGPLRMELAEIFRSGIAVLYLYGNHDKDSALSWDSLVGDYPVGNLHARVVRVGELNVAGLAGVFKQRIWLPPAVPLFHTRAQLLRHMPHQHRWRGGIPLRQRDGIFPEDFEILSRQHADILVCHEAPATHPFGFQVIDDLARRIHARLIVFGHHHTSTVGVTADGIRTVGLAKTEVLRIRPGNLG